MVQLHDWIYNYDIELTTLLHSYIANALMLCQYNIATNYSDKEELDKVHNQGLAWIVEDFNLHENKQ